MRNVHADATKPDTSYSVGRRIANYRISLKLFASASPSTSLYTRCYGARSEVLEKQSLPLTRTRAPDLHEPGSETLYSPLPSASWIQPSRTSLGASPELAATIFPLPSRR